MTTNTVRTHLDRIRDKTGARTRADLTRYAIEAGIEPVVLPLTAALSPDQAWCAWAAAMTRHRNGKHARPPASKSDY